MSTWIQQVTTTAFIPTFTPAGTLFYAQDTGALWMGTGYSLGSDVGVVGGVNIEQVGGSGGGPGGFNGDIQYNNNGALGGSAASITAAGTINIPTGQNYEINGVPIGGGSSAWAALTGDLTSTQVIPFDGSVVGTPDTGVSRLSSGVVGIGTGASTSTAGGLVVTTATIPNLIATAATVGNTLVAAAATVTNGFYAGCLVTPAGTITSATVASTLVAAAATVTNGFYAGNLVTPSATITTGTVATSTVSGSGYISALTSPNATITTLTSTTATIATLNTVTATVASGSFSITDTAANKDLILFNTTAATATSTNASPLQEFAVFYDNAGTFTGLDTWTVGSSIIAGSNGSSRLNIAHAGSTSTPYVVVQGEFAIGSITLRSAQAGIFGWSSTADPTGTSDTGFSRIGAGVIGVGNGAAGSEAGSLRLSKLLGPAANSDITGTISGATTTAAKGYAVNYTTGPVVVVTPTTICSTFYVSSSTLGGFVVAYGPSQGAVFNYYVMGNPS